MLRRFLISACISGATAAAFGAFGAHGLQGILTDFQLHIWGTGVRYQFYHTFALLAIAILGRYLGHGKTNVAGWLMVAGIVCFSGSLYILALADVLEMPSLKPIVGPLTPVGGVLLIAGWVVLLFAAAGYKHHHRSSSS